MESRKGRKNVKFADMEDGIDNTEKNDIDPYINDMKSQLNNYGSNSSVLSVELVLSEQEQVRRYLIGEIIETEESYVKGLQTLYTEFIIPIMGQGLIKRKYKETITCNIPELLLFHRRFLEQLVQATEDSNSIPEDEEFDDEEKNDQDTKKKHKSLASVFYELCNNEFVEMYTNYIKEYQNMLDVYAKYNKDKKLQKYLKNKRREKKPLTNHLILPIQRVTRYLLLLQELKKKTPETHSDYKELEAVLTKIVETVNMINERQREIENMSQYKFKKR